MRVSSTLAVALAATFTDASVLPRAADAGGACPAVWTQISKTLTTMFVQADGQCNHDARTAVRAAFHDCGTWSQAQGNTGGCDGSLFLSAEENARVENRGLQDISNKLTTLAKSSGVGVADMIAFAGAHATVSCPLGPTVKTMVGRKDSATPAPNESLLPGNATLSADIILSLFADKGFSAPDVAALIGAHSSAQQFFADPSKAGAAQDRTPGIWDVDYYVDTTANNPAVFTFQSDKNIAADPRSGPTFKSFIGQQAYVANLYRQYLKLITINRKWNQAFADTFARMMLLGVPKQGLVDCTSALPPPRDQFPGANLPLASGPAPPNAPPGVPTAPPKGAPTPPKGAPTPPKGFPDPPKSRESGKPSGPRGQKPSAPGRDAPTAPARDGYIAPTPVAPKA
jgi:Peroxidase